MVLTYREASKSDANLLIDIYNSSFYEDYIHYGECPGYGKTKEQITLVTPSDKEQNIKFYTEKCGFNIDGKEVDGNVEVTKFIMER